MAGSAAGHAAFGRSEAPADGIRSFVLLVLNGSLKGGSAHVGFIQPFDGSATTSQALKTKVRAHRDAIK